MPALMSSENHCAMHTDKLNYELSWLIIMRAMHTISGIKQPCMCVHSSAVWPQWNNTESSWDFCGHKPLASSCTTCLVIKYCWRIRYLALKLCWRIWCLNCTKGLLKNMMSSSQTLIKNLNSSAQNLLKNLMFIVPKCFWSFWFLVAICCWRIWCVVPTFCWKIHCLIPKLCWRIWCLVAGIYGSILYFIFFFV